MDHRQRSLRGWLIPLVLALIAAALTLYRLNISLWYDETFSYGLATQPWHVLVGRYLWGQEANMTLYYLFLRAWLWLTGALGLNPTEVVVRLPSAIFAIAAAVVLYALGSRVFGRVAGVVAAVLYVANSMQLQQAQTARSYSLEILLLVISWYCLFAALDGGPHQRRWWAAYVTSSVLAVYSALFSALVLAAQVIALILLLVLPSPFQDRVRAAVKPIVASLAMIGVLAVPIVVDAALHGGPNTWIGPARLGDVRSFFFVVAGGNRPYEWLLLGTAFLGGVLALVAWARPRLAGHVTRPVPASMGPVIALGCWLVVPIAISFALTQPRLNLHLFLHRYLVVVVPPLCLLAGLGVGALRWRPAQAALALALVLGALPQVPAYYKTAQIQDFRDPVQWVQQRYQAGDGLVCDPVVQCGVPFDYYLRAYPGPAHFDADSPGRFIWPSTTWIPVDRDGVLSYAADHRRIFFIFGPLGNGAAPADEAKSLESALAERYPEIDHLDAYAAAANSSVYLYRVSP